MAKKKTRRRRRSVFKKIRRRVPKRIPLLPTIGGLVAPMLTAVQKSNFISDIQSDPLKAIIGLTDQIGQRYTGFSMFGFEQGFHPEHVIPTYLGLGLGVVGSKLATMSGVNRTIGMIPYIGKKIKL